MGKSLHIFSLLQTPSLLSSSFAGKKGRSTFFCEPHCLPPATQTTTRVYTSSSAHDNCPGFYGLRRPVFHSELAFELSYNPAFMCHQNIGCAAIAFSAWRVAVCVQRNSIITCRPGQVPGVSITRTLKEAGILFRKKGIVLKLGYSPLCKNNIVTRMPKPSAPAVKLSAETWKNRNKDITWPIVLPSRLAGTIGSYGLEKKETGLVRLGTIRRPFKKPVLQSALKRYGGRCPDFSLLY